MKKHQVELKIPRIEDSTPRSMRDAFIEHTKLMIESGYDPEPIMCGLLWASATLFRTRAMSALAEGSRHQGAALQLRGCPAGVQSDVRGLQRRRRLRCAD